MLRKSLTLLSIIAILHYIAFGFFDHHFTTLEAVLVGTVSGVINTVLWEVEL